MNKTTVTQYAKTSSLLPRAQGMLQRQCVCGNHVVAGGKCVECAKNKNGLQRKLSIGASNDPLEREADRIAEQVMAAPPHFIVSGAPPHIQRFTRQPTEQMDATPASVEQTVASSGSSLEPALRQDMEHRFGHDFSRVRVHSGEAAEQSARDVNADAYTVGHNIVFGAGQFIPGSQEGRRLIAHELTHVVQQSHSDPTPEFDSFAPHERNAHTAATAVGMALPRVQIAYQTGLLIARQPSLIPDFETELDQLKDKAVKLLAEEGIDPPVVRPSSVKKDPSPRINDVVERLQRVANDPGSPRAGAAKALVERINNTRKVLGELNKELWGKRGPVPQFKQSPKKMPATPTTEPPATKPSAAGTIERPPAGSNFRTAGRLLAGELPGMISQLTLMLLFPPRVNIHNNKAKELSRTKLEPAVQGAFEKQESVFDKLLAHDQSQSIYANVTAKFDYKVYADNAHPVGDAEVELEDITFLDMKITNEDVKLSDPKFDTRSRPVTKQVTYSLLLYEPEYVTRNKEWARAQQEYQECRQRFPTVPPTAGTETPQENPEEGPCIPPHKNPMDEP